MDLSEESSYRLTTTEDRSSDIEQSSSSDSESNVHTLLDTVEKSVKQSTANSNRVNTPNTEINMEKVESQVQKMKNLKADEEIRLREQFGKDNKRFVQKMSQHHMIVVPD